MLQRLRHQPQPSTDAMPSSQLSAPKASSVPSCQLEGAAPRSLPHVAAAEHSGQAGQAVHGLHTQLGHAGQAGWACCTAPGMAPHQAPNQEAQKKRREPPMDVGPPASP